MEQRRTSPDLADLVHALWIACACLCLCHVAIARAEDAAGQNGNAETTPAPSQEAPEIEPGDPPGYFDSVRAALAEHGRGNFLEARIHFQRAHEIFPNARTLRGLGKVEFELRNYGEAVTHLKSAMLCDVRPLDPALRVEAEQILARAQVYVGEVRIEVEPDSALVSIDGVTVIGSPNSPVSLLVGDHLLEFRAVGKTAERRSIRVRSGEEILVHVVLSEPQDGKEIANSRPGILVAAPPATPRAHDERWLDRNKAWFWTTIAVVAAGVLAAGLGLGLSGGKQTQVEETPTSVNTPPGARITVGGH